MIESRYGCNIVSVVLLLVWVAVMVMSLAYPVRLMSGLVGVGMSAMYRLKREGERTPPCGTPVLKMCIFEL